MTKVSREMHDPNSHEQKKSSSCRAPADQGIVSPPFFTKSPVLIKNETRIAKSSRVYPLPEDSSVTGYMIPAGGGTSSGRKE
jgi:hypothetical protein